MDSERDESGLDRSDVCWAYLQPVEMCVYINRDREKKRWKQTETDRDKEIETERGIQARRLAGSPRKGVSVDREVAGIAIQGSPSPLAGSVIHCKDSELSEAVTITVTAYYRERVGFPSGSAVKALPAGQEPQETQVQSLGREDPLEEGTATHPSILAWRIPTDREAWQAIVHRVAKSRT